MDFGPAERALANSDESGLLAALAELAPEDTISPWSLQLTRYALSRSIAPHPTTGPDQVFLESIVETRRICEGGPPRPGNRILMGAESDFLAEPQGIGPWSIAQCLNHLMLSRIRPRRRAAVVGTMRDDGIYILEWVAHYLALGFDHVIIYTNDNSDGSEKLLRLLADHGVITLIEDMASEAVAPDDKAYGHALHLLPGLRDFEWALFVDSDELFVPGPQYNCSVSNVLDEVHRRFPDKSPAGICYHWLWFVSGDAFARKRQLLLERFQHARRHYLTKCLAHISDVLSLRLNHAPWVRPGGILLDSALDPIEVDASTATNWWKAAAQWKTPQYQGGRINHYWPKSFEEFAVKKARGRSLKLEANLFDRPFHTFFRWNGPETDENYYPVDSVLVDRVKKKIKELEKIEGVRSAATEISRNFPVFLQSLHNRQELRAIYKASKIPPGEL